MGLYAETLESGLTVLYKQIASKLDLDVPEPDLVIYLQASTPVIMERIHGRNLEIEKPIEKEYIDALNETYNQFFFNYSDAPLLVVKTDDIDFVHNENQLADLIKQIKRPQPHIMYYAPAGDLDQQVI